MLTNNGFLIKCNNNTVARCGVSSRDNRLWIYQDIIMNQHFIANVKDPRTAQDAATKNYTDTRDNLRVLKAGDTMSGVLNMNNNNKITNIPVPSSSGDATNKTYVDAKATNNVGLIGILTGGSANKNGFVVTSSGDFSSNYASWKIWDVRGSPIRAEWATPGILANYWVMIQSVAALTVHKFHIAGRYKDSCQPSSWRIEGSNDGINFTVLHTSTVTLTSSVMEFQFNPAPNVEYNYFKFYATASSLTTGNPGLSYFMLF